MTVATCEFRRLQWKLADMAIKLESVQLLLYRAAANADRGLASAYETAVAKTARPASKSQARR
jgi:alkylation response protein AidB-like acyl-CoA dehydrogenase